MRVEYDSSDMFRATSVCLQRISKFELVVVNENCAIVFDQISANIIII